MAEEYEVITRIRHEWPSRAELEGMRDRMTSAQIAEKLGIPQKTVCNHFLRMGINFRQRPMSLAPTRHKQKKMHIIREAACTPEAKCQEETSRQTLEEFIAAGGTITVLPGFHDNRISRPACTGIDG